MTKPLTTLQDENAACPAKIDRKINNVIQIK